MAEKIRKLLITGAAGKLGGILREGLKPHVQFMRLSDLNELVEPTTDAEEFVKCDLANGEQVARMIDGVDTIVHMGGAAHEQYFEPILRGNLMGIYNLYDAALKHGIKRVVLASSNHVTGFYTPDDVVSPDMAMKPDSLYAASKGFGEMVATFYHLRHGIETVSLRIGSCLPRPKSPRCMAAWLSYRDFIELTRCALFAPDVGHAVVYGVSNNPVKWWQDDAAERIGYRPQDSAAEYVDEIAAMGYPMAKDDPRALWQGGHIQRRDYRNGGHIAENTEPKK